MAMQLPLDDLGRPIPVLGLKPGGAHRITVTAASARNPVAFAASSSVIGIYATGPVFIATGDASVTASTSDHYFPEGTYYDLSLGAEPANRHSHIAAIRAGADCVLYVSEKE